MEFRGEIDTVVNPSEKAFFSVRDIHAWYGESYIVQGVSFDVNKGEVLSLLGRNGAARHRRCARWRAHRTRRSRAAKSGSTASRSTR